MKEASPHFYQQFVVKEIPKPKNNPQAGRDNFADGLSLGDNPEPKNPPKKTN